MWLHVVYLLYIFVVFYLNQAMNSSVCDDVTIKSAIQACFNDAENCVNGMVYFFKPYSVTKPISEVTKLKIETTTSTTEIVTTTVTSTNQKTTLSSTYIVEKVEEIC